MLARCQICGSTGTHRLCGNLTTVANWTCSVCAAVEDRIKTDYPVIIDEVPVSDQTDSNPSFSYPQNHSRPKSVTRKKSSESEPTTSNKPKTSKPAAVNKRTASSTSSSASKSKAIKRIETKVPVKDGINLHKITIMPSCFDYFPHDRQTILMTAKDDFTIPDWRMTKLSVNLVDCLVDILPNGEVPSGSHSVGREVTVDEIRQYMASTTESKSNSKTQVKQHMSNNTRPATKVRGRKRGSTKVSSWRKGIVKAKKNNSKGKKVQANGNSDNLTTKTKKSTSVTSSTTTDILRGIRESHTSLRNWLSTTENTKTNGDQNGNENEKGKKVQQVEKEIKKEPDV